MLKSITKNKVLLIIGLSIFLAFTFSSVFARPYWHWGYRWYRPYIGIGVMVNALPYGYSTVIIDGVPYYYYDGYYLRPYHTGYIVVPEPPAVVATPPDAPQTKAPGEDTVIVYIPNSNGSYTSVVLTKNDKGYVGPKGEIYNSMPTVDQLKALYGVNSTAAAPASVSNKFQNGTITVKVVNSPALNGVTNYFSIFDVSDDPLTSPGILAVGQFVVSNGTGSGTAYMINRNANYHVVFTGGVMYNIGILADLTGKGNVLINGNYISESLSNTVNGNITITIDYGSFYRLFKLIEKGK